MRPPIVFMPLWIKPSVLKKEVTMFAAEATTEPQKLNLLESLFNLLESLFIADDNPDFLIPALTPDFFYILGLGTSPLPKTASIHSAKAIFSFIGFPE